MNGDNLTVVRLKPKENFVTTPLIAEITERALLYLEVGYPIHFSGPAGTGKTTLALHVASLLNRPVILIHGDDEFGTSDLIGGDNGYRVSKVVDNYIHSVLKTEESMRKIWLDNRLTHACKYGFTLIYDEFTRSRPEANNVLLSILEEGILGIPTPHLGEEPYIRVHPDFRAIFTSNPEEYAGVHKIQDALLDRMISLDLTEYNRETEIAVTSAKSGLSEEDTAKIVDVVRDMRHSGLVNFRPTLRASIMIAKVLTHREGRVSTDDPIFVQTCLDVLGGGNVKIRKDGISVAKDEVMKLIHEHLG